MLKYFSLHLLKISFSSSLFGTCSLCFTSFHSLYHIKESGKHQVWKERVNSLTKIDFNRALFLFKCNFVHIFKQMFLGTSTWTETERNTLPFLVFPLPLSLLFQCCFCSWFFLGMFSRFLHHIIMSLPGRKGKRERRWIFLASFLPFSPFIPFHVFFSPWKTCLFLLLLLALSVLNMLCFFSSWRGRPLPLCFQDVVSWTRRKEGRKLERDSWRGRVVTFGRISFYFPSSL